MKSGTRKDKSGGRVFQDTFKEVNEGIDLGYRFLKIGGRHK